jgi:hypothetical protein
MADVSLVVSPPIPTTSSAHLKKDWIVCFCVVEFDIEVGQKLTSVYPPIAFSEDETTQICFNSFPDCNIDSDGQTIYFFRVRRSAGLPNHSHKHHSHKKPHHDEEKRVVEGKSPPGVSHREPTRNRFLYAFVSFSQQKDARCKYVKITFSITHHKD